MMKKLLTGLLILGSFSAFSQEISNADEFTINELKKDIAQNEVKRIYYNSIIANIKVKALKNEFGETPKFQACDDAVTFSNSLLQCFHSDASIARIQECEELYPYTDREVINCILEE